ncbi:MAG: YiiG family protein [Sandaracinaceae bacterium]
MHLSNRRITRIASCSLLLLLTGACGLPMGGDDEPPPVVSTAAPAPVPAPAPAPIPPPPTIPIAEQQSQKIADFVDDCSNAFADRVESSRQRYERWVSEGGPTGDERHISHGVHTIGNPSRCRQAVDALPARPPSMPAIEAASVEYVSALEQLYPVLARANTYYERESYRDDGAARGRELHPQLIAGWDRFEAAHGAMSGQLRAIEDQARASRLERLANDPTERSRFLAERTISEARALADEVQAMELVNRRLVVADTDAFVARVQTFQTHVDEMRGHRPAAPEPQVDLSRFKSEANDLLTTTLALMRRVRDETPFSRSELGRLGTSAGWMTDGSPDKFLNGYNDLIRAYNALRYRPRR